MTKIYNKLNVKIYNEFALHMNSTKFQKMAIPMAILMAMPGFFVRNFKIYRVNSLKSGNETV